jgi:aerobic carbon-monoxide dehydrogenase small subunit
MAGEAIVADKIKVSCTVNGKKITLLTYPMTRLLDALREELQLTGTKEGCGEGECGACSVILDGKLVNSCLVPVAQISGSKVKTVEGLAKKKLHPIQESFLKCGGAQCGICTPGMIIASVSLLEKKRKSQKTLKAKEIREWLAGNLCRCTGYQNIVESVEGCKP